VENEARLRHQIRQALDPVVPDAPWVTPIIRKSLREQTPASRRPLRWFAPGAWSGARIVVAILLVIAIAAGLLVGSRALNSIHHVPGPSQPDPAVQKYRVVVGGDFSTVENLVQRETPSTCNEARAADCLQKVQATKAATQKFLDDLGAVSMPPQLGAYDAKLRAALAHLNSVLDEMVSELNRRDFAAYSSSAADLFNVKLDELYPYVIAVDCWPKAAIPASDAAGYSVVRCGATTAQQYVTDVANDWVSLRSSIDASSSVCQAYRATCDDRTRHSSQLVQQFKNDLSRTPAPIQYTQAEKDLEDGLNSLMAALDDRITAMAANDHRRWDSANMAIDQVKFSVLAKAIGEMSCWPKGVLVGANSSPTAWPCSS
jgi:hypothetical protein